MENKLKLKSTMVKKMCYKKICDIKFGFSHYIARTSDNKIYSWNNNSLKKFQNERIDEYFELIIDSIIFWRHNIAASLNRNIFYFDNYGDKNVKDNKFDVEQLFDDIIITDVKCGFGHSIALTNDGEVYAWGCNLNGQIGNGKEDTFQSKPSKVNGFNNNRVVMISCGFHHSMALTEKGHVFSWGNNSWGQLGFETTVNSNKPKLIELNGVSIKKISCGRRHSLLLTDDGFIYAFGDNSFGQLGDENRNHLSKLEKVNHENIYSDIETYFDKNISITLSVEC
jgi:alpha-tubulin suppressor-like RCC1 family protein